MISNVNEFEFEGWKGFVKSNTWRQRISYMCEWLSCGDWWDVRLICGDRSFNAHRAVLASVSTFLRKVLLSCPVDESPVFIFLPEFDIDAMSSVLFYIYNGKVLIPNHKLKMFIDTANAMEIFIDTRYIPETKNCNQHFFEPNSCDKIYEKDNYICQLKLYHEKDDLFIDVKKNTGSEELVRQQHTVGNLNLQDKFNQTFSWSKENISHLGNLTSISGYRQKQTFLRKGNINGQTPGVLAISNEEQPTATSVHFSNATKNYAGVCEAFSVTPNRTFGQSNRKTSIFNYFKQIHDNYYRERNKGNINLSYVACNHLGNNFNTELQKEQNINFLKKWSTDSSSAFHVETQSSFLNLGLKYEGLKSFFETPKVTILNEVLQNPWNSQQPKSYVPFPKKALNTMHFERNHESKAYGSFKDKNNNRDEQIKINANVFGKLPAPGQQDLRCIVCYEVFTRRQEYSSHMRRHTSITRYSCEECHKTFSQLRNYKYHMSVHRGTKEFAATCTVCGKHFNDKGYLSNHMKIHRNRKEYKCSSCPKSFNQRVAFNMHLRIHTGVKPHVCEECGKAFSRKMILKQHQRIHSGERPYACAYCDKRFADRSNMTLHLRLHTGVKPFSCTLCAKSFTKKHHLKSHLNFHTGVKPYSCPRCKLAFTQSSNMRTHLKKCNMTN